MHGSVQNRDLDPLSINMAEAWLAFWAAFVALAALDFFLLAPKNSAVIPGRVAVAHCFFWFGVGLAFNLLVLHLYDWEVGVTWFNGYILEYLLSLDNVFFFHVVFQTYATPDTQIYKALYLGILGAIILRLLFYMVGTEIFRMWWPLQIFFGLVLVWSGYKTAFSEEDDDDPKENPCVKFITRHLPLADVYDDEGSLFIRGFIPRAEASPTNSIVVGLTEDPDAIEAQPIVKSSCNGGRTLGSMLLLVVLVLQVIDLVFAVDSVTAKIATFDNIFINFSSSAFAMLCLRSLYFVLIELMNLFWALKYGVALILALVGLKVSIAHWFDVDQLYATVCILGIFGVCMVISLLVEEPKDEDDDKEEPHKAVPVADQEDPSPHNRSPRSPKVAGPQVDTAAKEIQLAES